MTYLTDDSDIFTFIQNHIEVIFLNKYPDILNLNNKSSLAKSNKIKRLRT